MEPHQIHLPSDDDEEDDGDDAVLVTGALLHHELDHHVQPMMVAPPYHLQAASIPAPVPHSPTRTSWSTNHQILLGSPEKPAAPTRANNSTARTISFGSLCLPPLIKRDTEVAAILEHCGKVSCTLRSHNGDARTI